MIVGIKYKKKDGDYKGNIYYFRSKYILHLGDRVLIPTANGNTEGQVFVIVPKEEEPQYISREVSLPLSEVIAKVED